MISFRAGRASVFEKAPAAKGPADAKTPQSPAGQEVSYNMSEAERSARTIPQG